MVFIIKFDSIQKELNSLIHMFDVQNFIGLNAFTISFVLLPRAVAQSYSLPHSSSSTLDELWPFVFFSLLLLFLCVAHKIPSSFAFVQFSKKKKENLI